MRFHRRYPVFQRWIASESLRRLITPDTLSAARFEPTMQAMAGGGVLDLIFGSENGIAVIPFVDVTPSMLLERELTPIMWPAACRALPREHLEALEAQIVPWLQSLTFARQLNREELRWFSPCISRDTFETARAANLLGAASYEQLLVQCSPYVYAMRFARGKRVGIADPSSGTGAALLAGVADVRADLQSDERNALAREWFGADLFGAADAAYDVAVYAHDVQPPQAKVRIVLDACPENWQPVQVAHPVPTDVMFSFDPEDSSPARTFGVFAPAQLELRQRADGTRSNPGGSSGRILLLVRENWQSLPDADVDEAQALAQRLEAEGFTVRLCGPAAALRDMQPADMVHVFTLHHADEMLEAVERYASFGTPVVATAALPRVLNDTVGMPYMLMSGFALADEIAILDRLDLLELQARNAAFKDAVPRQGYSEAIRALLAHVRAVLVNGEAEEQTLRDTHAYSGPILRVAPLTGMAEPEPIAHLTGDRPFAFVHSPTEARANLPLIARAAAELGIPVVASGPIAEPAVQRVASEILGEGWVHVPRPTPGQLEALYRAARVFIDLSWMPRGLSRVARAIACGCPVLISDRSHARSIWTGLATAAPGSFTAIREGLARLWESPAPVAPRPADEAFLGVVAAYAQAQSAGAGT